MLNKNEVPIFVKIPSSEKEWLEISKKIETRWNFPHALSAIDGKNVTIRKQKHFTKFYYNCKHTHSIILMAIAGPEYECLYADFGYNGRVNDSGVWNKSSLLEAIQDELVKLPSDEALRNGDLTPYVTPYAFSLKKIYGDTLSTAKLNNRCVIIDIEF